MQGYLTSAELCRLTGLPMGTLKRLRASGWLRAAQPGGQGRGHADRWSLPQALGITVARGLRRRGVSLEQANAALQYLWSMSGARLEAHFKAGRTCLALLGTEVLPRLLPLDSILANNQIDYATAASVGMLPAAVDVQRIWTWITAARSAAEEVDSHPKREVTAP
jgi:hypothetical protein